MPAMTMETMGHMLLEPVSILPSQLPSSTVETPEKRLLLAVLEEAVGTYQRNVMATDLTVVRCSPMSRRGSPPTTAGGSVPSSQSVTRSG